jgi:hypothetical protein
MLLEAAAVANPVLLRGKEELSSFAKVDFGRARVDPVEEDTDSIFQFSQPRLAGCGVEPTCLSPGDLQILTLSSPGLLPSHASKEDPEVSLRSPRSCSMGLFSSPRSVIDMF